MEDTDYELLNKVATCEDKELMVTLLDLIACRPDI